ncbi:MAG: hypothetical protein IKC11_00950 [Clostridia bacterium]|nr:hypothetical protein [Clostridia bacterium]
MTENEIVKQYGLLKEYYNKFLKDKNVKFPNLKTGDNYTKDALTLIYLSLNYPNTKVVSKSELTRFIQEYYPDVNDVQQARHLGAQKGWYIVSGTRNDNITNIKPGEYKLISLESTYPGFTGQKRIETISGDYWEDLKLAYNYRCATCGSKEGEANFNWPETITKLQKGHMDPNKPLEEGNIIPQCEKCNRADRNYWIYDEKGRVVKIANPKVIDNCSIKIQKEVYARLYKKFNGEKPSEN